MSDVLSSLNLKPLKITCTSSDCGNGLHCFQATSKMRELNVAGHCRSCNASLVDWKRVHSKDPDDIDHTVEMLNKETIRHHFWHSEFDQKAINHARRKGRSGLEMAARARIRTSIGVRGSFDGRQTPRTGNVLYYAQHATASCCRKCVETWHGVPIEQPLSADQIEYLAKLCLKYVFERMPNLTEHGETIPPARGRRSSKKTQ